MKNTCNSKAQEGDGSELGDKMDTAGFYFLMGVEVVS